MPRPGSAFSNHTEYEIWAARWCDTCLVDAPWRNGISQWGCPLLTIAFSGEIPDEWIPDGGGDVRAYRCTSYKPHGWRKPEPEPTPEPVPDGQLALFTEDR